MERNGYLLGVSIVYLVAFIVTLVILFTDHNLQTDFGTVKPYFIHWYGLLITGIVSLIGFGILLAMGSKVWRAVSVAWSLFMVLFMIADIATYSMVGFSSPLQFARYLFGVTKYPGTLSYIPGLYDLLFAIYVVSLGLAVVAYRSKS
ncbi:hypothetical protein GCM10007108_08340 [Thermogymnomonas acidicola]|uniref:Uncharacterized protein n=1 Tax=Thermogymnomonas acidicola TaxID=399579 RepID=A0AA37BR23_9ARCH|nr:hypothetical protein [Thermogymnomonas acidicola]GGM72536.1 hypothetical protein GCM10007108_08340 [Thermogymnomonas acidicola]